MCVGVFVDTSVCGCVISVFWVPRGCILLLSAHSTKQPLPHSNHNRTEPVPLGSCFNVLTAERRSGSVPFGGGSGRVLCSWTHAEGGEGGNGARSS